MDREQAKHIFNELKEFSKDLKIDTWTAKAPALDKIFQPREPLPVGPIETIGSYYTADCGRLELRILIDILNLKERPEALARFLTGEDMNDRDREFLQYRTGLPCRRRG